MIYRLYFEMKNQHTFLKLCVYSSDRTFKRKKTLHGNLKQSYCYCSYCIIILCYHVLKTFVI